MSVLSRRFIFWLFITMFSIYTGWIIFDKPGNDIELDDFALRGKQLFRKHNCIACHQIYGLGGYMGPELTNAYSRNGERYLMSFILNGTAKMPRFGLDSTEARSILRYLRAIDSSSCYRRDFLQEKAWGFIPVLNNNEKR